MASDYRQSTDTSLPRGIRNNNPGDIKDDGTAWQGKVGSDVGSDGTFVIFADMGWGCRAMGQSITNMVNEGDNTLTLLISAWAPASENPTSSYIANVASATGLDPNATISLTQATLASIMRAMITQEVGQQYTSYVTDADITTGIGLMSNSALSLLQAGVVVVQENPVEALIIIAVIIAAGYLIFRKND